MNLQTMRMTLTGPFTGKTCELNGYQFKNGVCDVVEQPENVGNIVKYFQRCYQVNVSIPGQEVQEEQPEPEMDEPTERQQAIIAAVNGIDKEDWIELDTNPHPRVKDVATLMEDPAVTKDEILEVIEKWLS